MVHCLQSLSEQTFKKEVFHMAQKDQDCQEASSCSPQAVRAARSMQKKHMVRRSFRRIQEVLSSM